MTSPVLAPNSSLAGNGAELPTDWQTVRLDAVADLLSGGTPSKSRPEWWAGAIPWASPKDMKRLHLTDVEDHISEDALRHGSRLVPAKTIFVVIRGMVLAKELPVAMAEVPMAFNQDMKAVVPRNEVDPEYLLYVLASRKHALSREIGTSAHGTRRIGSSSLEALMLPLPPKWEQITIATVLRKLEAAVEIQDGIVASLKELKASAMAKLFREGLRGEPLKQTEIGEIPESWEVTPLGQLIVLAQYGLSIRGERSGRSPMLRMNCQDDGRVIFRDLQFVDLDAKIFETFRLSDGDLLFNRTNSFELVGRTSIFHGDREAVFASYLIRLRVDRQSMDPDYLNYYLQLRSVQNALKGLATRGVSQSNISASKLRLFPVGVPSLKEQRQIAETLDRLSLAVLEAMRKDFLLRQIFAALLQQLMSGQIRVRRGMTQRQLGEEALREIVRRIVEAAQPEKIILFGSAARGEMGPDSDVDLLVVKSGVHRRELAARLYRELADLPVPKDIIVATPEDLERHRDTVGLVYRVALREGRVVYDAA